MKKMKRDFFTVAQIYNMCIAYQLSKQLSEQFNKKGEARESIFRNALVGYPVLEDNDIFEKLPKNAQKQFVEAIDEIVEKHLLKESQDENEDEDENRDKRNAICDDIWEQLEVFIISEEDND